MSDEQVGGKPGDAVCGVGLEDGTAVAGESGSPFVFLGWAIDEGGRCSCAAYAIRPERLRMGGAATLYYCDRLMGVASGGSGSTLRENYAMLMRDAVDRSSRGLARVSVMRGGDPAGWGDDGLWLQFRLAETGTPLSGESECGRGRVPEPSVQGIYEVHGGHILVIPCQGECAFELGEIVDGRPMPYPATFAGPTACDMQKRKRV